MYFTQGVKDLFENFNNAITFTLFNFFNFIKFIVQLKIIITVKLNKINTIIV